jgi:hypothetical protein
VLGELTLDQLCEVVQNLGAFLEQLAGSVGNMAKEMELRLVKKRKKRKKLHLRPSGFSMKKDAALKKLGISFVGICLIVGGGVLLIILIFIWVLFAYKLMSPASKNGLSDLIAAVACYSPHGTWAGCEHCR